MPFSPKDQVFVHYPLFTEKAFPKKHDQLNESFAYQMEDYDFSGSEEEEDLEGMNEQKLTEDETMILRKAWHHNKTAIDECLASNVLPSDEFHPELVELCCESNSGLSETWERMGGTALRIGLFNQCDLLRKAGTQKAMDLVRQFKPEYMWASLPCGPTSPLQRINERTMEGWIKSQRRKKKSRKLIHNALKVMELHLCQDGVLLQEWPKFNEAWEFPEVQKFWNVLDNMGKQDKIFLDGCMFGLKTDEGLLKKPWQIRCTQPGLVEALAKLCDGSHTHMFQQWEAP